MTGDQTLRLVREGYGWASRVRGGAPAAPTRLLGRPAVVVGGPEGVRRFYDPRLRRRGAIPLPVHGVLFGRGALHGLDDDAHHRRKAMLLEIVRSDALTELAKVAGDEWDATLAAWPGREVVLFDEAVTILARTVLSWAGVPAHADEPWVGAAMATVVDGFATPGKPYARALLARRRLDRWATQVIRSVREGRASADQGTAVAVLAWAEVRAGRRLSDKVAAVELLNVLRPTIAVAYYIAWAGLRLAEHPEWRARVREDDEALEAFVHEVRRASPFVPVLAAKARHAQDVLGVPLRRGGLVVLDVDGTDHHGASWPDPLTFDPARFLGAPSNPDAFVPQGGGDAASGHRCPGESATVALLQVATKRLAAVPYSLPPQDLMVDRSRVPAIPRSRVVLRVAG